MFEPTPEAPDQTKPEEHPPVEFDAPEGFHTPEGTEPGADWDLVCSFRTKPDGKVCLVKLGDTEMPGYDEKQNEVAREDKPDYSAMMPAGEGPK